MHAYIGAPKTKRILNIAFISDSNTHYFWPPSVEKMLTEDNDIWGDYRVCPFTPQKPKVMQTVCIDSVSRMHVVQKKNVQQ